MNKLRISRVENEKLLLEFGEFEKIVFFGDGFGGTATIGTSIPGACVHDIGVVVHAVLPSIVTLLDESVITTTLE